MVFKKKKKIEPEINEEEVIDMPKEEDEIDILEAKIDALEKKAKEVKNIGEEEPEEVPEAESTQPVQQTIPQTRKAIYLTDSEAIRQILIEIQGLRSIVEQEIAKE